jgi:hypothetical protein
MPESARGEDAVETETTKAMQEALHAAVTRMNGSGSNGNGEHKAAFSGDMMGVLMSVVSKLLQGSESSEELVEKLDALQKGDLTSLREQVRILRKQCFRMLKSQEQLFLKVEEIQREQNNVARAVLDLAHHMARITFIDDAADIEHDAGRVISRETDAYHRTGSRAHSSGLGRRPRGTSVEHGSTSRAGRAK